MKFIRTAFLTFVLMSVFSPCFAETISPNESVQAYVTAFKTKDLDQMVFYLHSEFLNNFKSQYSVTLTNYSEEQRNYMLQEIFKVNSMKELDELSPKEMMSRFMNHPMAAQMWKMFDEVDIVFDEATVNTISKNESTVDLPMRATMGQMTSEIITQFQLEKEKGTWRIKSFTKKYGAKSK